MCVPCVRVVRAAGGDDPFTALLGMASQNVLLHERCQASAGFIHVVRQLTLVSVPLAYAHRDRHRWLVVVNVSCAVIARFGTTGHVFLTPFVGVPEWIRESLQMDLLLFILISWTFAIVGLLFDYWYGIRGEGSE